MSRRKTIAALLATMIVISSVPITCVYRGWRELAMSQCKSNLFQAAFPIAECYYANKPLPPARFAKDAGGAMSYSWRAFSLDSYAMSPQDDLPLRYNFEESWDSPQNASFMRRSSGRMFACPADHAAMAAHNTNYVAVVGKDTLWRETRFHNLDEFDRKKLEQKILLIEIPASTIPWTQPTDISLDEALELFSKPDGLKDCPRHGGLLYVTLGMKIDALSSIADEAEFRKKLTIGPDDRKEESPKRGQAGQGGAGSGK